MEARRISLDTLDDAGLVQQVQRGQQAAFGALMRRYNRRLYRTARAILKDDGGAEDALQEAYVSAYRHIGDFRGDAAVGTWLTRIVVNQSLQALRKSRRERVVVPFGDSDADDLPEVADDPQYTPESLMLRTEMRRLVERKIDELPEAYRTVFMLREVEDLTVDETAAALDIPAATVRSRLFRAKARMREALAQEMDVATQDVFGFDGERCDRIVRTVLGRIAAAPHPTG
ncbi:MAG TPA: RNA polymerase sigma factor [Casimicrobiaceae bacterium]|nr:RNA polymerase sigma factor [Casimicrobiaceae bacterium]